MLKRSSYILPLLLCAAGLPAEDKLAPFEKDGKWGYRNTQGRVIIEPRYVVAQEFSREGIAAVADEKEWLYIDAKGNVVVKPFLVDNGPDDFREGLARFRQDNKFGFFDKTGRKLIEARFDFARPFSDGMAAICFGCEEVAQGEHAAMEGGKWGFINNKGEIVIPPNFDEVGDFKNGRAEAVLDGRRTRIDKKGRTTAVR